MYSRYISRLTHLMCETLLGVQVSADLLGYFEEGRLEDQGEEEGLLLKENCN